jgi:hypothetical protein
MPCWLTASCKNIPESWKFPPSGGNFQAESSFFFLLVKNYLPELLPVEIDHSTAKQHKFLKPQPLSYDGSLIMPGFCGLFFIDRQNCFSYISFYGTARSINLNR